MPSYGGSNGPDGSKKSGDQGQGTRDKDGGQTGRDSAAKDRSGAKSGPQNDTTATYAQAKKLGTTPDRYIDAASAYRDRIRDRNDEGNSFIDNAGNMLAGLLGFDEVEPDFNLNNLNPNADWSLDPIAALAAFAGLGTGLPASAAWDATKWGLNKLGVETPSINLGPDVFGGMGASTSAPGTAGQPTGNNGSGAGNGGGKSAAGNGLLAPRKPQQVVSRQPQTPPSGQTPTSTNQGGTSKLPTPQQKFQAPSYYAGDWQFDEGTQQVVWVPKRNGLLAA